MLAIRTFPISTANYPFSATLNKDKTVYHILAHTLRKMSRTFALNHAMWAPGKPSDEASTARSASWVEDSTWHALAPRRSTCRCWGSDFERSEAIHRASHLEWARKR